MSSNLIQVIKQAAKDAIDAENPADLRFGTVTSVAPLQITVTPSFILPEPLLVVPEHLKNHMVDIGKMGPNGSMRPYQVMVYSGLAINDRVAMLRAKGGQHYFILGRISGGGSTIQDDLR